MAQGRCGGKARELTQQGTPISRPGAFSAQSWRALSEARRRDSRAVPQLQAAGTQGVHRSTRCPRPEGQLSVARAATLI